MVNSVPQVRRVFKREGQMPITMQRKLMSVLVDLSYHMRIALHALPDQKERGTDIVFCQHIQYLGRVTRMRAIVKRQSDLTARDIPMI